MHMQSITSNIFKLIKNFIDIIDNKYCMVVGAKYDSSIMNDAHTNYLADIVSLPAKVTWPTMFFLKKKVIFIQLLCWPLASRHGSKLEVQLNYNI